ncbi:MAG: transcriptional regulator [Verrucomicrobia bacterium]|nr:transcriptional regulator [Verrucomicrobiota bacterium]
MNASAIVERMKSDPPTSLLPIQQEMASIFADLADLFGNPSSLGSIYGLLFASPKPLSMEEIVDRLDISVGTASQGLRRLVEMQAITPRKEEGERVTRYEAKLELRPFVAMFLEQQLLPKIGHSAERIEALKKKLSSMPEDSREELGIRMERASKWHRRAKTFLPLVRKFLGG